VSKINASIGAQAVKSVDASLTNPQTLDLRDTDVLRAAALPTSAICIQAIQARQKNREIVTIITHSEGADANYKVNWNDGVTVNAQAQLSPQVAGQIAAGLQSTGSGTLTGNGLVYGVVDNALLLQEYVANVPKTSQNAPAVAEVAKSLADQTKSVGSTVLKSQ
jgi:hypothetical protein